jgi:hypothetical protein
MFHLAAWGAAVEVLFDNLFDDRAEEAIFALKTLLIFRDKPLEMMKKHPIKNGLLGMSRIINCFLRRSIALEAIDLMKAAKFIYQKPHKSGPDGNIGGV